MPIQIDWTINGPTMIGGLAFIGAAWRMSLTISKKLDKIDPLEKRTNDLEKWNVRQDRAIARVEGCIDIPPMDMG